MIASSLACRRGAAVLVLLAGLALAACGPSSGDDGLSDDQPPGPGLRVEPGDVTLTVEGGVAATQVYTVIAVAADGGETDVTDEATLSLSLPSLGSFAGGVFTTALDRGGRAVVRAEWQGLSADADLTIVLRTVVVEPGVPGDAPDRFDGAPEGGNAPALRYPASGTIVPPNLNALELQFEPGAGNDLFEITFTGDLVELVVYLPCTPVGAGCAWLPSEDTWDLLATAARGETPLWYSVRGLPSGGGAVGSSTAQWIQFSRDDLLGGIYYWNAGAGAVMRYEFGRRGQSAENFLGVAQTGATTCVGCHTLTRDGSRIAIGLDIPGPAGIEAYTVSTREKLWGAGGLGGGFPTGDSDGANFTTFSPDGETLAGSDGSNMWVRAAGDGAGKTQVLTNALMPDWSPGGDRIVFARSATSVPFGGALGTSAGSLLTVDTATWTDQRPLVTSTGTTDNNYYPAYSPDGNLVVFNKSALDDSYDATDARVWVVNAAGGAPVALGNASPAPGGDSWPKWAPFVHGYHDGNIMWLTFSSRRPYGLRGGSAAQVWMVGIDPSRAAAGQDPSFAAFWLPFQDFTSGNHIAQWVENIDRQECTPDTPCPTGEFCEGGVCLPVVD
ncbi:MAG: PD40 domain-containing protein [Kofleriaceae bacterium]|nr:PD40 domain-containing protein [Myxococcales bacterium]MCB9560840.1 PD40 domain-containing protein [Kofleriaceae bacterium]